VRIAAQRKISHYGLKKNSIMLAVEARWVTLSVVDARARPKIVWGLLVVGLLQRRAWLWDCSAQRSI